MDATFPPPLSHPLTYPCPVEINGDEGGGDGEVIDEGVELQHEPELVAGGDKLDGGGKRQLLLK